MFCFLGLLSASAKLIMEWQSLRLRVVIERAYNERLVQAVLNANWTTFVSVRFGDISNGINMESRNISFGAIGGHLHAGFEHHCDEFPYPWLCAVSSHDVFDAWIWRPYGAYLQNRLCAISESLRNAVFKVPRK